MGVCLHAWNGGWCTILVLHWTVWAIRYANNSLYVLNCTLRSLSRRLFDLSYGCTLTAVPHFFLKLLLTYGGSQKNVLIQFGRFAGWLLQACGGYLQQLGQYVQNNSGAPGAGHPCTVLLISNLTYVHCPAARLGSSPVPAYTCPQLSYPLLGLIIIAFRSHLPRCLLLLL